MGSSKIKSDVNKAQHFINGSFDNLEMLSGSFTTHKFKPHFHESYTIIFVEDGIGDYSCYKSNYIVSSGSILILNPYEVHTGQSFNGSPWNFMTMYVPQEIMRNSMLSLGGRGGLPFFKENKVNDRFLFKEGLKVFSGLFLNHDQSESESSLTFFLKRLIQDYAFSGTCKESNTHGLELANKVRDYLHKHYLGDISLNQLSNMYGIAEYNLVRIFKSHFQLPPHQYLLNLRIENSKRLLSKKYSSTEAAYHSGFFDQSHFIRHFKKIIGITPGQFACRVS